MGEGGGGGGKEGGGCFVLLGVLSMSVNKIN